ncbi:MAG: hypothetical protein JSW11_17315 [Candidatus Heimdallarchaeota archaeon]|nr:MAG: hypothetical protein JSW11_17315 [Candidatus Heimdallarchaeota archaeon]
MSEKSIAKIKGRPIYFLLHIEGLSLFDIRFSVFAPNTDGLIIGGLASAISTFSDNIMDNISGESGSLNVIERENMKIMFERGKQVTAILLVDVESHILMEKIRVIIDLFEHNYLEELKHDIVPQKYTPFRNLVNQFILVHVDENLVYKRLKDTTNKSFQISPKFIPLLKNFDGKKSLTEISRNLNWPLPYVITRTAMLQELGYIKSIDISIRGTDIFQIEDAHLGILLEQGGAFHAIKQYWGDWGVKITQKIDGKHTISSLSAKLSLTEKGEMRMTQLFRYLSLAGYIKPLTDDRLLLIIFTEFLNVLRQHLIRMLGDFITFDLFEIIFHQDLVYANDKGRIICVAKLVENYEKGFHFEKFHALMKSRSQIIAPLFQHAFFPFMDNIIRNLAKISGKKVTMDLFQIIIIEIEQHYGKLIYDILFSEG